MRYSHCMLLGVGILLASNGVPAVAARAAAPTTAPATLPADFERRLDAIDAKAAAWRDLSADFVQEKRSPLLRKPIVSRGTVKTKGAASLWQTAEPESTLMSVGPRALRLYYPKQKVVEEYPIEGRLGMLAASPLPRLASIRQNFKPVADDGAGLLPAKGEGEGRALLAVRMNPGDAEIAKFVDHARVLLDADRGLVLAFELIDPDGERTVIRFSNLRGNAGLGDDAMQLQLPAGVKVTRPLEGAG